MTHLTGELTKVWSDIQSTWATTQSQWRDSKCTRFEHQYWSEIERHMTELVDCLQSIERAIQESQRFN